MRSLSSRFPNVMALLTGAAPAALAGDDDTNAGNGGEDEGGNEGEDGEGEGGDPPADPPVSPPAPTPAAPTEGDDGADASNGARSASLGDAQMLQAFERDASALVTAERKRCIAVFTSDAGKSNPVGAATLLEDSDVSADSAIKILGGVTTNSRSAGRERLNGAREARPVTGQATDAGATTNDVVAAAKAKRKAKAKAETKKGAKRVGGEPADVDA